MHCTIQPAKPNQKFISKKSANTVFENYAQSTQFLYDEAVGMLKFYYISMLSNYDYNM